AVGLCGFFFSSRRRHTRCYRDWSSDVCSSDLVVLDIAASRDRRPTFLATIRRVAAELSIPLTAGGGIRTLEDGRAVVRAGADKVTVNTAAVARPELITELSREFGAQAVVLASDAKRNGNHWEG